VGCLFCVSRVADKKIKYLLNRYRPILFIIPHFICLSFRSEAEESVFAVVLFFFVCHSRRESAFAFVVAFVGRGPTPVLYLAWGEAPGANSNQSSAG
jgi:hypothetical protein